MTDNTNPTLQRRRIGQDIADLRKRRGLTQQNVADLTGIQRPHIARVEQGTSSTGFDTLQTIANALSADICIVPRKRDKK